MSGVPASFGVRSGSAGSLPMRCTTSARNPSMPRSSQKRSVSCIAASTSGFVPVQVGLLGQEQVQVVLAGRLVEVHAGRRAKCRVQLLGGPPSGAGSRHTYQSRLGSSREERDSTNQGCWSEVWFGTQSSHTCIPRSCAAAISESRSASGAEDGVDVAVVGDVVAEVGHRRG
jgi:hypothetical protein